MNNLRPLLCFSEKTNWWCYPNRFSCKFKNIFDCQITYERIINEPKITSGPNFSLIFWGEKWSNFLTSNCEVKSSILLGHCVLKNELLWVLQSRGQNYVSILFTPFHSVLPTLFCQTATNLISKSLDVKKRSIFAKKFQKLVTLFLL